MLYVFLFIFGLLIGSFLNVVALRYDGDHFIADPKMIGGRSRCPHCGKTLHWYELIPVISFVIQKRRCRGCGALIGWQYPLVELISACIFTFIPLQIFSLTGPGWPFTALATFWVVVFEILLLIGYIDIRLGIIPDELNILLGVIGIFMLVFVSGEAAQFGPAANGIWVSHLLSALGSTAFFGLLVLITRGKGMGMGDVKLAFPLGLIFGWPGILVLMMLAFVVGAIIGLIFIGFHKKSIKGSLPFAPFLVLGAVIAFFWGQTLIAAYLHLFV